jgi:hypothetical protein
VKNADGGEMGDCGEMGSGEAGGTVMCQRSDPAVLAPVMKGVTDEGESKNATEVLVKRACP